MDGRNVPRDLYKRQLEEFMLDIMYEIPKDPNIGSVVVTRPYLEKKGGPLIQVREG